MLFKKNFLLSFIFGLVGSSSISARLCPMQLYSLDCNGPLKDGNATIFIHGTTNVFPLIEPLFGGFVDDWLQERIKAMCDSCPHDYSYDSFYLFRWPGSFSRKVRKNAAERLYEKIRDHKGSLTIIGHSHGCNIALYLAELCENYKNKTLKIDKLILLAPPVQEATAHLIESKIFKRVFSFYSDADVLATVLCPQRVTRTFRKKLRTRICSSQPAFRPSPNLLQARILINYADPGHFDFCSFFLQKLPETIAFLELNCAKTIKENITLNISADGHGPILLNKEMLDPAYLAKSRRAIKRRSAKKMN